MTPVRSVSPKRFVPLCVFTLSLAILSGNQAPSTLAESLRDQRESRGSVLAFTPKAIWNNGVIGSRLGIAEGSIYLLERPSGPSVRGRVIGDVKEYFAYDARVSPTGDLVAFHGRLAPDAMAGDGVGVFNTEGKLLTFIRGGATFSWSPRGTRLAVSLAGADRYGRPIRRGVVLWRKSGPQKTFDDAPSRVGWAGEDSLLLQLGRRVEVINLRSGRRKKSGHHGTVVSPDGFYSMWPGENGENTRVIDDETGEDVTSRFWGPLEREGLREIRSAFWVRGRDADHYMCVSGTDHVYVGTPRSKTIIIEADTGETIAEFPGEAIGPTGDNRSAVVLRHESGLLNKVDLEGHVMRWIQSNKYY